jgi:hypothetical protein
MDNTIESVVEILVGAVNRKVNIRLTSKDKPILYSIARQINCGLGLTDRQIDMILLKIEKYKPGLIANSVAIDEILSTKLTRLPMREIDRSQRVMLAFDEDNKRQYIIVKHQKSREFYEIWLDVSKKLNGYVQENLSNKIMALNELNIQLVVNALEPMDFTIDPEIQKIYGEIEKIVKNPEKFQPTLKISNSTVDIENFNFKEKDKILENFEILKSTNFLKLLSRAKNAGISINSIDFAENLENLGIADLPELTKLVILENTTKFQINIESHTIDSVLETVNLLDQWPLIIIVDDDKECYDKVTSIVDQLKNYIEQSEITVFFRLKKDTENSEKFHNYIADNHLNNYITNSTKVVVLSRSKIPKPLLKSGWKPNSAISMSNLVFGKMSVYLNDVINVYYYNDSIITKYNKVKGL